MSQALIALRKDALLQWRTRGRFVAVFVFGATALLLFSFAIGPNAGALRQHAAGFAWPGIADRVETLLRDVSVLASGRGGGVRERSPQTDLR